DLFDFQIIHVHYLLMICPCGAAWAAPCRLVIVYHISAGSTRGSLPNVPNEITISPSLTKKTKCPQKRHFVVFVGFVDFVGAHFLARGARFLGAGASVRA